jgi:isoquinoline 1-oxidoreductase subunit beta
MNFIQNPTKLRGFEKNIRVEKISRRSILKGLGVTGGFVLAAPVMSRQAFAYETGAGKMPHGVVVDPRVFVAVAPDGTVTILAHRSEMGTGVRTSLPLIVAEEMEADWSKVKVQQAHGDEVKFGNQDTDGSRSTRHYLIPMRQIGASARGRPQRERTQARLRRTCSRRRQGIGAEHRRPQAEGPQGLPLSDQGPDRYRRSP